MAWTVVYSQLTLKASSPRCEELNWTTPCLKKTSRLCLAITVTHVNGFWYFFGRNVTDKVDNQKTHYCATLYNLCFCATTWQNGEIRKLHFSFKCCISTLPEFNQSLTDFLSLFDSQLILTLLYDSLNLVISAFSSRPLGGHQDKRSQERCSSWTMLHTQCTSALSSGFPLSQGNAEALDRWGGKTDFVLPR